MECPQEKDILMFNIDNIVEILDKNAHYAIPVSILISIAIALAGVLPSVFVTGANIVFFGPVNGFLISLLGETVGGYITFLLYRLGFKKRVTNFTARHRLLSKLVESRGKRAGALIFAGRLIPFIPSGFVTLAASVSSVNGIIFVAATLLGKAPSLLLEALVSYDIININDNWLRLAITIIALMIVYIVLKIKKPIDKQKRRYRRDRK